MKLYCDNKASISIAHNPVQHNIIKHVEIDRQFIKEKIENRQICTPFVATLNQLVDYLMKEINSSNFHKITSKLKVENIYLLT